MIVIPVQDDLQEFEEAGDILEIYYFRSEDCAPLIADAKAGDKQAAFLLGAFDQQLGKIFKAPTDNPCTCFCCQRAIREDELGCVCIIAPHGDSRSHAIGAGICKDCSADRGTLTARVTVSLQKLWPNGRTLGLLHEAPETKQ